MRPTCETSHETNGIANVPFADCGSFLVKNAAELTEVIKSANIKVD